MNEHTLQEANKSLMDEIGRHLKEKIALRETNVALLEAAKKFLAAYRAGVIGTEEIELEKAIAQVEARP